MPYRRTSYVVATSFASGEPRSSSRAVHARPLPTRPQCPVSAAPMGAASSRVVERVIGAGDEAPPVAATRTWGLENFGNTCYANSVLQALYACGPFRERALVYHAERTAAKADPDEHLLAALAELFASVRARAARGRAAPCADVACGARRSPASARKWAACRPSALCSG